MKRKLLPLLVAVSLMAGAPVLAQAQETYPGTTTTTEDGGNAGLWGLLGLVGLFALMRRNRSDYRDRNNMGAAR